MRVSPIFQDGMMMQRNKPICISGQGKINEEIKVYIQNQEKVTSTDISGKWKVCLDPLQASQNEKLTIISKDEYLDIKDIAVGEIWLAGGQSNMEFYMKYEKHYDKFLHEKNQNIRFYDVPKICFQNQDKYFDYSHMGKWRTLNEKDLKWFSSVGFYFANYLSKRMDIPVGIIGCNWAGTSILSWMSSKSWEQFDSIEIPSLQEKDYKEYWEFQKKNIENNTGDPFKSPFTEILMAGYDQDVIINRLMQIPIQNEKYRLSPHKIPGCLYENMVKKIAPFPIKGILWYQGESDATQDRSIHYDEMLISLINDWRNLWQEELPFLVVQLPAFDSWLKESGDYFPLIRKAQHIVSNRENKVWLCATSDLGEKYNLHPNEKKLVGKRLALLAAHHVYGDDKIIDAPEYSDSYVKDNKMIIKFTNSQGLHLEGELNECLTIKIDDELIEFNSEIRNETLYIVFDKRIENRSIELRFAQSKWYKVCLYNGLKIPALPFKISINN